MSRQFFRIGNLPPYPLGEIAAAVRNARLQGIDVIDLSQVNPDFEPPAVAVDKLVQHALQYHHHRYSASQGISRLRNAGSDWYAKRFDVELDPDEEVVVTMGCKEGMAHLLLSILSPGDTVLVPTPSYPVHTAAVFLGGGVFVGVPLFANYGAAEESGYRLTGTSDDFFRRLAAVYERTWPRPKIMIVSFPHNPTAATVSRCFFERLVPFCAERNMFVVHDFAYADLVYEKDAGPSILSVPGAKDVAVEAYSLSKGFNMAGWRIAFFMGNRQLIGALKRVKGYLDFGAFQPLQIAAAALLSRPSSELYEYITETTEQYRSRRDTLVAGLQAQGWQTHLPRGSVFVWARLPEALASAGSMKAGHQLLESARVAVCPGVGFDADAEQYVRFALVEPEHRLREGLRLMSESCVS